MRVWAAAAAPVEARLLAEIASCSTGRALRRVPHLRCQEPVALEARRSAVTGRSAKGASTRQEPKAARGSPPSAPARVGRAASSLNSAQAPAGSSPSSKPGLFLNPGDEGCCRTPSWRGGSLRPRRGVAPTHLAVLFNSSCSKKYIARLPKSVVNKNSIRSCYIKTRSGHNYFQEHITAFLIPTTCIVKSILVHPAAVKAGPCFPRRSTLQVVS